MVGEVERKRATTYIDTIRTGARTVPGLQMAAAGYVVDGSPALELVMSA